MLLRLCSFVFSFIFLHKNLLLCSKPYHYLHSYFSPILPLFINKQTIILFNRLSFQSCFISSPYFFLSQLNIPWRCACFSCASVNRVSNSVTFASVFTF